MVLRRLTRSALLVDGVAIRSESADIADGTIGVEV
jgi:hypothetical protein